MRLKFFLFISEVTKNGFNMVYWDYHNPRYVGIIFYKWYYKWKNLNFFVLYYITINILVIDKTQADFKVSSQDLTVHLNSQESFDLYLT